ncbi:unnamed protein product [Bursaphelenchus okinawaensis]|uniref:Uncharacterized protein n=1 Tax=Bursaphelenchus okinawaensis TaxID=465554 RepID=A0A811L4N8_9BILA|nr:unnamed protein product [Bursaphelenchus okinawaensis]CAG9117216.1 unnamed protein product [Bursaphelenchus okinawaensis]
MAWAQFLNTVLFIILLCTLQTYCVGAFRFLELAPLESSSEEGGVVKRQNDWKHMFGQDFKAESESGNFGFKGLRGKRGRIGRTLGRPCNIYKLISCF